MRKIYSFLSATWLMGALLLLLAAVLSVATFIENDYGTNAAKALVYNSWWFELIFIILGINLFINLLKFKQWSIKKLPVLLFHLSFFIIVIGAGITRYFGYEGTMHIREGAESNEILTADTYLSLSIQEGNQKRTIQKRVLFSELSQNEFSTKLELNDSPIQVQSVSYIPNASLKPIETANGEPIITLVISTFKGREEFSFKSGDVYTIEGKSIGFNTDSTVQINIYSKGDELSLISQEQGEFMAMQTGQNTTFEANKPSPLYQRMLYKIEDYRFVLTNFFTSAKMTPQRVEEASRNIFPDAVVLNISMNDTIHELVATGRKDEEGKPTILNQDGMTITASFGSIPINIPFAIHLNDFQLDRYPGSESPSSFASEVTLIDIKNKVREDKRIFMNNILNYKGYRFYQASYDTDEGGTILSVNRDFWGTIITYIGYLLMAISMFWALISKNTRFRYLIRRTGEISKLRNALTILLLLLLFSPTLKAEESITPPIISAEDATLFGKIWVQDNGGRIKPLNTLNDEILRKVVKHNSFKGLSSDQFILSLLLNPGYWYTQPIITIKHPELKQVLGLKEDVKKASFSDFIAPDGKYKIQEHVEKSYRIRPAYRNKFEQELIKVDEQINVFFMAQTGGLFKIFPNPDDSHATWMLPGTSPIGIPKEDSLFIKNVFSIYLDALKSDKHEDASSFVIGIKKYQEKYAAEILPSPTHMQLEVIYNKANIFVILSPFFLVIGLLLIIFQMTSVVQPQWQFKWLIKTGLILLIGGFIAHTLGLALRWYISGHAPWSNGYESMLYIAWSTLLAGLLFSKKSPVALSITGFFSGILLMVAHLSWMNPEITNLVPVLKSYWLTIHVAIIVASYGFLSLGALSGFMNLILAGLKTKQNQKRISLTIEEVTCLSEMAITVGIYLLTIGAFLGGVWANESWGRYWGWDPKETWSIITVFVYAFIIHMRLIPGLKNITLFNFAAVIAFSSVIMTYLGVNYYLAGMHSYAKGDPVPIPSFVYYTILTIAVVSIYAFYNEYLLRKKEQNN